MHSGDEDDGPKVETMRAARWRLMNHTSLDAFIPSTDIQSFAITMSRNNALKILVLL